MSKEWFVVHTLTGQEYKVQESIRRRVRHEEVEELIGEVIIPTEKVLLEVDLYDGERKLRDRAWYFVKETPGVIGFVGGDAPAPLPPSEVEQVLNQVRDNQEQVKPKVEFEPGETVKITDGPFLNFTGTVEEVDPERGRLKVAVAIFGRSAPVELEYWQVERE